jgi:hypothetical protein
MASEWFPEQTMSAGRVSMLTAVSWQPTLTEHQVHLLRALARQEGVRLKVAVGRRTTNRACGGVKSPFAACGFARARHGVSRGAATPRP